MDFMDLTDFMDFTDLTLTKIIINYCRSKK